MELICIDQTETGFFSQYETDFQHILQKTAALLQPGAGWEVSCIAVTPETIHELNAQWRNVDRPTDVISFALRDGTETFATEEEENELGDIFLNIQAVKDQAESYGHSEKREACFLFCHGLLHLLGYDHMNPADEQEMFALQDEILHEVAER